MADPAPDSLPEADKENTSTQDMDVEAETKEPAEVENGGSKRARDEGDEAEAEEEEENGESVKKQKSETSAEEERLEKMEETDAGDGEQPEAGSAPVKVGPKSFGSSVEMFDYFFKLLHAWPTNLSLNKYEHTVLLELLKKGHLEPAKKIGSGIRAFQVRYHPQYKSRCFFLVREDESVDDFSFRKCVDHILPLPESMQIKHDANKALRGKGGRGNGRGRGRGRKSRY